MRTREHDLKAPVLVGIAAATVAALVAVLATLVLTRGTTTPARKVQKVEVVPSASEQAGLNATKRAAVHLRSSLAAAEAYYADHGSYERMSITLLHGYDPSIAADVSVGWARAGSYCLQSTVRGETVSFRGPRGAYEPGACGY